VPLTQRVGHIVTTFLHSTKENLHALPMIARQSSPPVVTHRTGREHGEGRFMRQLGVTLAAVWL
jgi:hypothetical protein